MSDNRTLTFVDWDSGKVTILDSVTGYCRAVSIPGVTKYDNISVAVAPDDAHLFILAADSYQPIEVFFVSIDDSSIKKVAELPVYYEHYHDQESYRYFLMSPDGSMIYFPKGFMVNTISGNIYQTVPGAVSWIHYLPSKVVLPQPIIVVTPQQGQRGTTFSFDFRGGFPIQEVEFWLGHESGTKGFLQSAVTDREGNVSITWQTDIQTRAGSYMVYVQHDEDVISTASLRITEP